MFTSRDFYRLLSRGSGVFTFQTFADAPELRAIKDSRQQMARILAGTGFQHGAELKRLSSIGAGVFMAVNEMRGEWRNTESVASIRTYYADLDDLDAETKPGGLETLLDAELRPSAVVESKNGFHAYWFASEGEDLSLYRQIELGIRDHFGACPRALDAARVLRAPGFPHLKNRDDPYMVRVVHLEDTNYTAGELASAYRPPDEQPVSEYEGGDIKPPERVKSHQKVLAVIDLAVATWDQFPWSHARALDLSARLYWYGLKQPETEQVMRQIVAKTGDDELEDRLDAVRSTYRRAASGLPVSVGVFRHEKPA